jgi:glycosyltransferase involved in cell wall biosynthesis
VPLADRAPGCPLKAELGIRGLVVMYVGNFEPYQGIDLLLESFALVRERTDAVDLVLIGGTALDVQKYRAKSDGLGIARNVHFLGPRPVDRLAESLAAADILVSPRITGTNTPMKLYSYLHSGKPLVATALPTHTQVADSRVAMLAEPTAPAFADAMLHLIEDEALRRRQGAAARQFIEERFTFPLFRERFGGLLDWLQAEVTRTA